MFACGRPCMCGRPCVRVAGHMCVWVSV
jgi:hypothetical protein